jgi:hypothetical protein
MNPIQMNLDDLLRVVGTKEVQLAAQASEIARLKAANEVLGQQLSVATQTARALDAELAALKGPKPAPEG